MTSAVPAKSAAPEPGSEPGASAGSPPAPGASPGEPLLAVEGLRVGFGRRGERTEVVRGISLALRAGECTALVGESGSGKSVTARTLLGLAGRGAAVTAERFTFGGTDLVDAGERVWRPLRGRRIGLVLQDALVSLDPLRTIGAEITEVLDLHAPGDRGQTAARVVELLGAVGVPDPASRVRSLPHQLSGGLRQRALIATALAGNPDLLVADEPTTALDATVQAQILDLLGGLVAKGTALLMISHDLAVVGRLADRVAVMHAGRVVEEGPTAEVLTRPLHPYTRALLAAVPATHRKGTRLSVDVAEGLPPLPAGCGYAARCPLADEQCRTALPEPPAAAHRSWCWHPGGADSDASAAKDPAPSARPVPAAPPAAPAAVPGPRATALVKTPESATGATSQPAPPARPALIEVRDVSRRYRTPDGAPLQAVRGVSLSLAAGETLGVVGESGSGKSTLARLVLGMEPPDSGEVLVDGLGWAQGAPAERRERRRRVQTVHQDPLGSFDPRWDVARIVGEAVARDATGARRERRARVAELLDQVGLPASVLDRRPLDLSGGQRQRVAIARALAPRPDAVVCDEPVSALDVSVQAQILDLLAQVQQQSGVALLFISHDLGVIHHVSDRVAVMHAGRIVESGPVEQVFADPQHARTRALLAAVPRPEAAPPAEGGTEGTTGRR